MEKNSRGRKLPRREKKKLRNGEIVYAKGQVDLSLIELLTVGIKVKSGIKYQVLK